MLYFLSLKKYFTQELVHICLTNKTERLRVKAKSHAAIQRHALYVTLFIVQVRSAMNV